MASYQDYIDSTSIKLIQAARKSAQEIDSVIASIERDFREAEVASSDRRQILYSLVKSLTNVIIKEQDFSATAKLIEYAKEQMNKSAKKYD